MNVSSAPRGIFALVKLVRRGMSPFVLVLLLIEFIDEFVDGTKEAALPLIRTDLGLSYDQIGLLFTLPSLIANLAIEPLLGVLADVWRRRVLILGGGIVFAVSLLLTASSQSYGLLMASFILFYPASGAFVSLSQATLMDIDPTRHEQNMVRWVLAGSIGVLAGLIVVGALASAFGWRPFYVLSAALTAVTWVVLWRMRFPANGSEESDEHHKIFNLREFWMGVRAAFGALQRPDVLRWLFLLEFSELMTGILLGYLSLYFVDVVGVEEAQAGIAVAVWVGASLLGELALIPLLERVRGVSYLRFSAALLVVIYSAFWLSNGIAAKLIFGALVGLLTAGWYSILIANLYTAMPNQSGSVMVVGNLFGLASMIMPLLIGVAAERVGLQTALVFPLIGCAAMLILLPRDVHRPTS